MGQHHIKFYFFIKIFSNELSLDPISRILEFFKFDSNLLIDFRWFTLKFDPDDKCL